MFEDLFVKRGTIARYRAAPLLHERLSYLRHCAQAGARRSTLRSSAAHRTNLIRLLDFREGDRVSVSRIESAARRRSRPGGRRCGQVAKPEACRRFVGHAVRWLRFVNLLDEPVRAQHPHAGEVAAFEGWMRHERGWAEETIKGCRGTVDRFFFRLERRRIALADVSIADIDRAVARWHARDRSRVTIHDHAQRLRTFFRFAERRGWCAAGLAEGILPSRFHRGETLPKGLNRDEVLRLPATTGGDRAADVRDLAILMVPIAYGLRSGEVAGPRLEDLNWERERLRVRRPKPGRAHRYPLSRGVGQAILRYLRELRPRHPDRALFFTLNAPVRPLSGQAISHVVRSRLDRLGIVGKRRGAHSPRHAAAQHLLDRGLSIKEVGDYLGHRGVSATSAYAKVRLDALREVADIDLGGLT